MSEGVMSEGFPWLKDISHLQKRSIIISGHATSLSLEHGFWQQLKKSAEQKNISVALLVTQIDASRTGNLSSALRCFILHELQEALLHMQR